MLKYDCKFAMSLSWSKTDQLDFSATGGHWNMDNAGGYFFSKQ